MQVTDEVVSLAIDVARKHAREVMGVACGIEPETMRAAIESALGQFMLQYGDNVELQEAEQIGFNRSAACIEELAAALKEVISVSDRATNIYDRARATLERWGLK